MKPGLLASAGIQLARLTALWPRKKQPAALSIRRPRSLPSKSAKSRKRAPQPVFVTEATFLRELIKILTLDDYEHMRFLTGPKLDRFRVMTRWAQPVVLDAQSAVYVGAHAQSVANVLITIIEQGAELHCIAHSHPGCGPGSTTPSGTDIACLGKLQKNGSPAIGCIVTRDNHVRFFTVRRAFRVLVQGTGVTEISKNVYRLTH